jgi:hypothetical protein
MPKAWADHVASPEHTVLYLSVPFVYGGMVGEGATGAFDRYT